VAPCWFVAHSPAGLAITGLLGADPPAFSPYPWEIVEGLVVDLDEKGDVVGFDIDHASRKLDLSRIETIALPPVSAVE
jgi:hypothetical protein